MNISSATKSERREALALLHGRPPDDAPVLHSLELIASGELDPAGLIVARSRGVVTAAILARTLPGSVGLILPARTLMDGMSLALTAAAVHHLAHVKVIQAFLVAEDMARGEALLANGFRHVTSLLEMRKTSAFPDDSAPSSHLHIVPYAQVDSAEFQRILARAHEDSLDCPELDRSRTPAEVFAGYRGNPVGPANWWLAKFGGESVGVALLAGNELTYLGVVPEWRRRGVGRFLLDAVCHLERSLILSVDARNTPAIQLYASRGFEVVGAHEVFLNFLSSPDPASTNKVSRL